MLDATNSIPTYAEIAEEAGVSLKTVCNVFRTPDIVRKSTRHKVIAALVKLGVSDPAIMHNRLRPNRLARNKSLLLLETIDSSALVVPVYSHLMRGAEVAAHTHGWLLSVRHKANSEHLGEALKNYHGKGILLFGHGITYETVCSFRPGIVAVRVMEQPQEERKLCDNVDYDRPEVSRLAANHLKSLGCRKLAYLGNRDIRGLTFLAETENMGIEATICEAGDIFNIEGDFQTVNRERLRTIWEEISAYKPDGIFVCTDQITNALYGLLAEKGIHPQKDLQIVSCNAEEAFLGPLYPRPATIDIHSGEIGRRGIDTLIWRMSNPEAPASSVIIRPRLIEGGAGT